jgi:hypothetical protein
MLRGRRSITFHRLAKVRPERSSGRCDRDGKCILRAADTVHEAGKPNSELVAKVVLPALSVAEQEFGQTLSRVTAITAGLTFATISAKPTGLAVLAALISSAVALWEHGAKAQTTSNIENVTVLRKEIKPMKFERFLDIVFETMCVAQRCCI